MAVDGREASNEQMLDMIAKQPSPTLRLHPGDLLLETSVWQVLLWHLRAYP